MNIHVLTKYQHYSNHCQTTATGNLVLTADSGYSQVQGRNYLMMGFSVNVSLPHLHFSLPASIPIEFEKLDLTFCYNF